MLHRAGARVLLASRPRARAPRYEAMAPAILPRLAALDLTEALALGRPLAGVAGSWAGRSVDRSHLFDPFGAAHVVERNAFDNRLRVGATRVGVPVVAIERTSRPTRDDAGWRVELSGSQPATVHASWLVDATGRAAAIARPVGAVRRRSGPSRTAFAGVVPAKGRVTDALVIESTEDGWWYAVQASAHEWYVGHVTAHRSELPNWRSGLLATREIRTLLRDNAMPTGPLDVLPASDAVCEPAFGAGWIAVGDAAAAHDPLDGAGVLRAFDSGMEAARALEAAASGRLDDLDGYGRRCAERFDAHVRAADLYLANIGGDDAS